jgi:phytanoyl-CoA hydroxylase
MLERFSIDDDFDSFYRENGYVVFTDLIDRSSLARVHEEIGGLFARALAVGEPDGDLRTLLADWYQDDRERWRSSARRMWDLLSVYRLAAGPQVETTLRKMGLRVPAISTRPEVRTDMPGDEEYRQPWHQDWRYGQGSLNAVTFWTPLHEVDPSNGTIDLIPGSHLRGYLEVETLQNPRRFSILDPGLDDEDYATAEMSMGETIVFSQFLVHRSGHNRSDRARVTVQTRFSDFAEERFVEAGYPAPNGDDIAWDRPPGAAELTRIFAFG